MLEHLPTNTQVLMFVGNHVPILDWNIFGLWDEHKDLEVVDFTNNKIKEIAGKSKRNKDIIHPSVPPSAMFVLAWLVVFVRSFSFSDTSHFSSIKVTFYGPSIITMEGELR